MRRIIAVIVLALVAAACEGPAGPMGPAGPEGPVGPEGPPGAALRYVLEGQIGASGGFTMTLPAELVNEGLPAVSCYISSDGVTWLIVDHIPSTSTGPACGLTGVGTTSPGVTVIGVQSGWFFHLVAVF